VFSVVITRRRLARDMPKFIDTHPMGALTPEQLKHLQTAAKDQFGVTHHDILYNKEEDRVYCVLEAPDRAAVEKHHNHAGIKCEWVREVESTRP
jgi:hypothetical protein